MSRIGRMPVTVPSGVDVTIDGREVTVTGPKGTLRHNVAAPIEVARDDGVLRVTDYKTGKVRAQKNFIIAGGKTLQPVLYALAAERLLGEPVRSGRLYYCTATGGYEERVVEMNGDARTAARDFVAIVKEALEAGFLPAAPDARECDWCDYKRVCGPYEERRVKMKPVARLAQLKKLREMP